MPFAGRSGREGRVALELRPFAVRRSDDDGSLVGVVFVRPRPTERLRLILFLDGGGNDGGRNTTDVEPVLNILYQMLTDYEVMAYRWGKTQDAIRNLVKPAVMSEISFLV